MMLTRKIGSDIVEAAEDRATALDVPVNIALLDAGGHLKAFVRMDGAQLGAIEIAMGKARTAILLEMTSEDVWNFCKPGGPAPGLERSNGGLVTFAGGIPLRSADNKVVGAIGVSGGTVAEDRTIAEAAAASFHQATTPGNSKLVTSREGAL